MKMGKWGFRNIISTSWKNVVNEIYKNVKKRKIIVDSSKSVLYNNSCVTSWDVKMQLTGCGSAWLERLVWDQEVAGSNPVTPTVRV